MSFFEQYHYAPSLSKNSLASYLGENAGGMAHSGQHLRIPHFVGHRFRSIVDTDSGRSWTLIPLDRGHRFRLIVDTDSVLWWTVNP